MNSPCIPLPTGMILAREAGVIVKPAPRDIMLASSIRISGNRFVSKL